MKTTNPILDQALHDEKQRQETDLVIDFDRAIDEEKQKAITVKWEGKSYKIPDSPPEWFRLICLRGNGVFNDEQNEYVFRKLFSDEFAEKLTLTAEESNWVNMKMANEKLMGPIIERWFGFTLTDTTKKKKTQESSSGRGRKSKRTSKGTTK